MNTLNNRTRLIAVSVGILSFAFYVSTGCRKSEPQQQVSQSQPRQQTDQQLKTQTEQTTSTTEEQTASTPEERASLAARIKRSNELLLDSKGKLRKLDPATCEGYLSITMGDQGFSNQGIRLQPHFRMYDGEQTYELEFDDKVCHFKGVEKQKEGMAFTLAGQNVRLHTRAKYRAEGVSVDTDIMYRGRQLRKLLVSEFECVEPGTGMSGISISD